MSEHPYSLLTPTTIIDAVEALGLLSDARVFALNSYENRVYQVGIEDETPLVAKFYRPQRWNQKQIFEEHQYTHFLADLDLPVVPPLRINGETLFEFEKEGLKFYYCLFTRKGGYAPELDNLDHIFKLGQYLGRIHNAGASQVFEHRIALHPLKWLEQDTKIIRASGYIPMEMETAWSTLMTDLQKLIAQQWADIIPPNNIRLHGDCHPGNILWRDDAPHFVDFDDAISGPAIQDLWMFLSGDRAMRLQQLSELAEGYNEFYDFPSQQLGLIEILRTVRLVHYNAWLCARWQDPAFPMHFPWFNTHQHWSSHILELREQLVALTDPHLTLMP